MSAPVHHIPVRLAVLVERRTAPGVSSTTFQLSREHRTCLTHRQERFRKYPAHIPQRDSSQNLIEWRPAAASVRLGESRPQSSRRPGSRPPGRRADTSHCPSRRRAAAGAGARPRRRYRRCASRWGVSRPAAARPGRSPAASAVPAGRSGPCGGPAGRKRRWSAGQAGHAGLTAARSCRRRPGRRRSGRLSRGRWACRRFPASAGRPHPRPTAPDSQSGLDDCPTLWVRGLLSQKLRRNS